MADVVADDGCPGFTATIQFDDRDVGKTFQWSVRLSTRSIADVSGVPTEVVTSETLSTLYDAPVEVLRASDGRLVVVGQPEPPAHHADRHQH